MDVFFFGNNTTYQPEQREFASLAAAAWMPCIIVLGVASVVGTIGNIFILTAVAKHRYLQVPESIFAVNLACSDLYVTAIADPFSIVAKIAGEEFFHHHPVLCRVIAEICTVSCTVSLWSIGGMSFSRYVNICHPNQHKTMFTRKRIKIACISFYLLGSIFVFLNFAGFGSHGFDRKRIECIFQTTDNHVYTIGFFTTVVILPIVVISISFILMYRHVAASKNKVSFSANPNSKSNRTPHELAKTLFIIHMAFTLCWLPFAITSIIDSTSEYSVTVHIVLVIWAHMHASVNWLVYFKTNKKFNKAFNDIFLRLTGRRKVNTQPISRESRENVSRIEESPGISDTRFHTKDSS